MENKNLDISNESTIDTNFNESINDNELLDSTSIIENKSSNETIIDNENTIIDDIDNTSNCLALVVRENYHIVVVKNFFRKSFVVSWKITLSMLAINFLNMFL